MERIRQADEALALELAEKEEHIRKLRGSTVVHTPTSSRKRPRKDGSDAKTTPATKKINKFFTGTYIRRHTHTYPCHSSNE